MATTNYQNAKGVLESLIQGVDPKTAKELTHETILNRADVMRALLTAVAAIDMIMARDARRAQLPRNVGQNWSKEEESTLTSAFKSGASVSEIARRLGRTERAIEARLEKVGLLPTEQRSSGFLRPRATQGEGQKRD